MSDRCEHEIGLPAEETAICTNHPRRRGAGSESEALDQSIPERFERIVRLYPDRLAVKAQDRSLTYDQLNRAANRIAGAIIERRGPGSEPIALLFEHGIDVITAILGVLKAGKFYVALDPTFPPERLNHILQNSEAPLLLVHHGTAELGGSIIRSVDALLNLDAIDETISGGDLGVSIRSSDPVNIRYTSGSTGVPKGVLRTHSSSLQVPDRIRVFPEDRLSLVHALSFGSSAMDLYLSLLNGAAMCLFDVKSEGVRRLATWLEDERITVCHFSPALFRELASELFGRQKLRDVRLIRLSGAPISRRDFELYRSNFPSETQLEISMGSTEAGLICSATVDHAFSFPLEGSPIGYPVKGIEIHMLDEAGREVPAGEIGEIAVRGSSLASGYWKESELTESKFLSDAECKTERIYLTGDLGRKLSDGFVIHLGRKDLTVKIRGYRVNIGETEAALLEHPGVKEAGVASWDREPGEKYLAGYIVSGDDSSLDASQLNDFLRTKLPDFMIPEAFMFLDSLPMTNGKLDRRALPQPNNARSCKGLFVPPGNDVEKEVASIWSTVLGMDAIGVNDNFFDLGGHSLAASRVASQVIKAFQIELPVKALFDSPTIAEMAKVIEQNRTQMATPECLERLLAELETMSEQDAQRLLAEKNKLNGWRTT